MFFDKFENGKRFDPKLSFRTLINFGYSENLSERLFRGNAYQVRRLPAGSGTLISRERLPGLEAAGWVRKAYLAGILTRSGGC